MRIVTNQLTHLRVGIVTGLKISKRATIRNRVKRILREVFRRHLACIRPGIDIVVHVKPSAPGIPFSVLADEVGKSLARVGALRGPWVDKM
jgi:ribonuclease P protein component